MQAHNACSRAREPLPNRHESTMTRSLFRRRAEIQFRRAPVRPEPGARPAHRVHRRRRKPGLRRPRVAGSPLRPRLDGRGRTTRGARAAADARHDRLAGCLSRLALRRRRPGRRQHAALGRRLRLHDRHCRAQAALVSAPLLPILETALAKSTHEFARWSYRGRSRRYRQARSRSTTSSRRHPQVNRRPQHPTTWRSGCIRRAPPAAEGHGAYACESVLDGRAVRQARARPDRIRYRVLRREAVLRLRARQCLDVPARRRSDRVADGRAADAGRRVQALDRAQADGLLRCADRLRGHARIAEAAASRSRSRCACAPRPARRFPARSANASLRTSAAR